MVELVTPLVVRHDGSRYLKTPPPFTDDLTEYCKYIIYDKQLLPKKYLKFFNILKK